MVNKNIFKDKKAAAEAVISQFGSIDNALEECDLMFYPGSIGEQTYRELKQGEIEYFKKIEN